MATPPRKFLAGTVMAAGGLLKVAILVVGAFMTFLGGPWAGEEIWWRINIGPQMARAQELEKEDKPAEALPIALSALETRPNDPRLLHFVSGLYIELDEPLPAYVYLRALSGAQGHFGSYDSEEYDLLTKLPIFFEQHGIEYQLRQEIDRTRALFDQLGQDGKVSEQQSPVSILSEPAASRAAPGYFKPDYPVPCNDGKLCALDMKGADLFTAVAEHKAQIHDPQGGADCCAVSLGDPDLRRLDTVQGEFVKQWEADHPGNAITEPDGANALLQFRSRLLAKQIFVVDFVQTSAVPNDPKDRNPLGVVIARYAGGFLCLAFFTFVLTRDDKKKSG
jgi:hypothetical protein